MSGAVTEAVAAMTGLVGLQLHRAVLRWSRTVPQCCFYHRPDSVVLQSQVEVPASVASMSGHMCVATCVSDCEFCQVSTLVADRAK